LQLTDGTTSERRARAYRASGADLISVDGIKTRDDLKHYAEKLGDLSLIYNGDLLTIDELKKYPFKVTIHIGTMLTIFDAIRTAMLELKRAGRLSVGTNSTVFKDFIRTMSAQDYESLEKIHPIGPPASSPCRDGIRVVRGVQGWIVRIFGGTQSAIRI
jgi:2-methylisocitrate lyase-like PEP mutase family enzyme